MKQRFPNNWLLAMLIAHTDERSAKKQSQEYLQLIAAAKELERLAVAQSELFLLDKPKPAAIQLPLPLRGGYWWGLLERPEVEKPVG